MAYCSTHLCLGFKLISNEVTNITSSSYYSESITCGVNPTSVNPSNIYKNTESQSDNMVLFLLKGCKFAFLYL